VSEGRVLFVEQLGELMDRFREVEVTLDAPVELTRTPANWRQVEQLDHVVRFVDKQFDEEAIKSVFSGVHDIQIRRMPLRSIFVALAKDRS
jgi:hypothetical protein